jgi:hypothetical protein
MRIFELKQKALTSENREYILGSQDTNSHACYMIYGLMEPHEKGRVINPGKGHEEIVLAIKGDLYITGFYTICLKEGSAFHIKEDLECFLENKAESEAVYIIAGGHSEKDHHTVF